MTIRPSAVTLAAVLTLGLSATPLMAQGNLGNPAALTEQAPATYKARFDTSKGVFVIDVQREWAPVGADHYVGLGQRVLASDSDELGLLELRELVLNTADS